MPEYVVNVQGVVVRDGEFLLIRRTESEAHAAGLLSFPGGQLETDPDTRDAIERTARRELREEVGVEAGDVEYVHSKTFETDDGNLCLNVVTLCEYAGGEVRARSDEEVAGIEWLTHDELHARDDVPTFTREYADLAERARTGT